MWPDSKHYCECCGRRYGEEPDILTEMFREPEPPKPPPSKFARAVRFAYVNREALGRARWQYDEEARHIGVYGDDWGDDGCPF
jgi:hypothetical protein